MTNVSGGVPTLRLMTRYRSARAVWPQLQDTIYSITYTQTFLLLFVFAFVFAFGTNITTRAIRGVGVWPLVQHLRGLVFRNQVSEESYCQIVVVLSLFCVILDLIQHHFHYCGVGSNFISCKQHVTRAWWLVHVVQKRINCQIRSLWVCLRKGRGK